MVSGLELKLLCRDKAPVLIPSGNGSDLEASQQIEGKVVILDCLYTFSGSV